MRLNAKNIFGIILLTTLVNTLFAYAGGMNFGDEENDYDHAAYANDIANVVCAQWASEFYQANRNIWDELGEIERSTETTDAKVAQLNHKVMAYQSQVMSMDNTQKNFAAVKKE